MNIGPMKALMTAAAVICLILMVFHFVFGIFTAGGVQYITIGISFAILFLIGRKSLADADEVGSGKFCRYAIMILLGMSVMNILLVDSMNLKVLNQLILIFMALNTGIFQPGGPMPIDNKE